MTVVLPPAIAERVPLSNPSAITDSREGCARCTWLSIPPGITRRPEASIVLRPSSIVSATAAMTPPRTPTSARTVSAAVTTVPPLITRSKSLTTRSPIGKSADNRGGSGSDEQSRTSKECARPLRRARKDLRHAGSVRLCGHRGRERRASAERRPVFRRKKWQNAANGSFGSPTNSES